jgi:hypothetical protein
MRLKQKTIGGVNRQWSFVSASKFFLAAKVARYLLRRPQFIIFDTASPLPLVE